MNLDWVVYKDGMPFYRVVGPWPHADGIVVEDLRIQQIIDYINKNRIKSAHVWHIDNYEWMCQCLSLENITLEFNLLMKHWTKLPKKGKKMIKVYDMSPLYELSNLKYLSFLDVEMPLIKNVIELDLSKLHKLQYFSGQHKYIQNLENAYTLKSLSIDDFMATNFRPLRKLGNLDTLRICGGKIESMDGIEDVHHLQVFSLRWLSKLEDMSALEECKDSLKCLNIESCTKIKDYSVLSKLKNLESLSIDCKTEIPSLQFINDLPNLKSFFCTANILDGDLTPCLRLQRVKFPTIKRHYNLKRSELPYDDGIEPFGMDNIEEWRRIYI